MHEFSELMGTTRALRLTAQSGKLGAVGTGTVAANLEGSSTAACLLPIWSVSRMLPLPTFSTSAPLLQPTKGGNPPAVNLHCSKRAAAAK